MVYLWERETFAADLYTAKVNGKNIGKEIFSEPMIISAN
jgi:hypothetical protein